MGTKNYRQISIKNIENGMIVASDVFDTSGKRLLAEGFEIKTAFKVRILLNQHNIVFIKVKKEDINGSSQQHTLVEKNTEVEDLKRAAFKINKNKQILKISLNKFIQGEDMEAKEIESMVKNTISLFKNDINIFQIMQSVKDLDDITYSHCQNVSLVSYSIGEWMELDDKDLEELALTGMLIDIGKIKVDTDVLNKEGKLAYDEFVEVKKHCIFSHEIIKEYDFISDRVKKAVLLHHERIDGSGYPLGLKGTDIPFFARIVAIADVYNALISHRPYRDKKTPFEAIRVLETEYMDKLDTSILYLFLRKIAENYIGQNIILNNGEEGEIVFIPKFNLSRPLIKMRKDNQILDLSSSENTLLNIIEFA